MVSVSEPSNPGIGTFGYVVYQDGRKAWEEKGFVGKEVTNNVSEYSGLIHALEDLLNKGIVEGVQVRSDSKLLVHQMNGRWEAKKGEYLQYFKKAKELASRFTSLTFTWVRREENREADLLSRLAYQQYRP